MGTCHGVGGNPAWFSSGRGVVLSKEDGRSEEDGDKEEGALRGMGWLLLPVLCESTTLGGVYRVTVLEAMEAWIQPKKKKRLVDAGKVTISLQLIFFPFCRSPYWIQRGVWTLTFLWSSSKSQYCCVSLLSIIVALPRWLLLHWATDWILENFLYLGRRQNFKGGGGDYGRS